MSKYLGVNSKLDKTSQGVSEQVLKLEQERQEAEQKRLAEERRQLELLARRRDKTVKEIDKLKVAFEAVDRKLMARFVKTEFEQVEFLIKDAEELFDSEEFESARKRVKQIRSKLEEVIKLAYQRKSERTLQEYIVSSLISVLGEMGYEVNNIQAENTIISLVVSRGAKKIVFAVSDQGKMFCDLQDGFEDGSCGRDFSEIVEQVRVLGVKIDEEESVVDKGRESKVIDRNFLPTKNT